MDRNKERDMETLESCPSCEIKMELKNLVKTLPFKGVDITVNGQVYVCPDCDMEIGTTEQVGLIQAAASEAYRVKIGLLSGEQIRRERKRLGLSQKALADKMTVGIASIKRWEGIHVQSPAMDKALRSALWEKEEAINYKGNKPLSLARIKLVLECFNKGIKENLIKNGDKLLFSAKYLWYADFVSFREHGHGMTGATYAALTYGPQLNNYKELIDFIWAAKSEDAEPLSGDEKKTIAMICKAFPTTRLVYDAAHLEYAWEKRGKGDLIPYSDSVELTQI